MHMAGSNAAAPGEIGRRDLFIAGAGAAALVAAIGNGRTVLAQTAGQAAPQGAPPGTVEVERRGSVLLIGINRPQAQNRFDPPIILGIGKAYYQLDHDDGLRVAVLHGIGANFSLGVDLPAFLEGLRSGVLPPKDPDFINPFGLRPPFRAKPVVVAAQGGTQLGAHELFLACDIRVAASDSAFRQHEVARGVFPGGGATVRFTREAGWANAMRYMLTGDEWGAEEAHRLGLVQEVTPPGTQLDRAIQLAEKIAAAAPLGVRATLATAHQAISAEEPTLQGLLPEFQKITQSEDAQEAQRAFRENRQPVFRGR
jgi:enoyl-CoA hydratase